MKGMQKIKRGSGFRGALNYALEREKGKDAGEIIGGNMSGTDPQTLAREFGASRRLRPDIKRPVWHNSLRLPKGERLTKAQLNAVGGDYMKRMGFSRSHQYVLILHDDPEGQHIHIIASRVALDGAVYLGQNENLASTRHIQELEKVHQLTITKGPEYDPTTGKVIMPDRAKLKKGEIEQALRTGEEPPRQLIGRVIDEALASGGTVGALAFVERLEAVGITVYPAMATSTDRLNGFSFEYGGIKFKGSEIGKEYGLKGLVDRGLQYEQDADGAALRRFTAAARGGEVSESTTGRDGGQSREPSASVGVTQRRDADAVGELESTGEGGGQSPFDKLRAAIDRVGRDQEVSAGSPRSGAGSKAITNEARIDSISNHGVDNGGSYERVIDLAAPETASADSWKSDIGHASGSGGDHQASKPADRADRAPTADEVAKIKSWRAQHGALKAPAYRITLKDRAQPDGRDRTYNLGKRKDAPEQFYSAQDVEDLIPRLRRENARGFDVYITPIDPLQHYIVIDDSTPDKLAQMREAGYTLALVQQSSAGNVQAIIRSSRDDKRKDEQKLANQIVVTLNLEYGDPKFSGVVHPFRMAGFSNKKSGRENAFTRVLEASGRTCFQIDAQLAEAREKATREALEREETRKQESAARQRPEIDLGAVDASDYGLIFMDVAKRAAKAGLVVDASRVDFQTCRELLQTHSMGEVQSMLISGSPGITERHADVIDYARRTVEAAAERNAADQTRAQSSNHDHDHGHER